MLGRALKRLPPNERRIEVYSDDVDRMKRGGQVPKFRVGFKMDEQKYKRIWVTIWGPANVPDLEYEPKPEKTRVFKL